MQSSEQNLELLCVQRDRVSAAERPEGSAVGPRLAVPLSSITRHSILAKSVGSCGEFHRLHRDTRFRAALACALRLQLRPDSHRSKGRHTRCDRRGFGRAPPAREKPPETVRRCRLSPSARSLASCACGMTAGSACRCRLQPLCRHSTRHSVQGDTVLPWAAGRPIDELYWAVEGWAHQASQGARHGVRLHQVQALHSLRARRSAPAEQISRAVAIRRRIGG